MKSLLLLMLAIALLSACPSTTPHPILTDRLQAPTTYRYTTVDADRAKTIEAMIAREDIVARYANKSHVAYVVQDTATTRQRLQAMPFQSLEKATLVVKVRRVSAVIPQPWSHSTAVFRETTQQLELPKAKLAHAFTLLQKLQTDPRETIDMLWPGVLAQIDDKKRVAPLEKGFQLEIEAQLVTGNPFDASTRVPLYRLSTRTEYARL